MSSHTDGPCFISAETARAVFRWEDAIAALQAAYAQPAEHAAAPPRTIAQSGKAWLRTLLAAPPGGRYFGAKVMGMAMASATPGVEYVVVLFDRETSKIAGFLDFNLLTGFRTAATSASALDKLAPREASRLGVIGSGLEASMHARAFAAVRDLSEVVVFSPNPERRQAFADAITRDLGVPARAVASPQEAVADADIALAAARSHGDYIHAKSFGSPEYARAPYRTELGDGHFLVRREVIPTLLPPVWADPSGLAGSKPLPGSRFRSSSRPRFTA